MAENLFIYLFSFNILLVFTKMCYSVLSAAILSNFFCDWLAVLLALYTTTTTTTVFLSCDISQKDWRGFSNFKLLHKLEIVYIYWLVYYQLEKSHCDWVRNKRTVTAWDASSVNHFAVDTVVFCVVFTKDRWKPPAEPLHSYHWSELSHQLEK